MFIFGHMSFKFYTYVFIYLFSTKNVVIMWQTLGLCNFEDCLSKKKKKN